MSAAAGGHADAGPGFWRIVWLLLVTARRRAVGRQKRQAELLRQRAGRRGLGWDRFGFAMVVFIMLVLNIVAAFVVRNAVAAAERVEAERAGWTVVDPQFAARVGQVERLAQEQGLDLRGIDRMLSRAYRSEATHIAQFYGGDERDIRQELRQAVHDGGTDTLLDVGTAAPGVRGLPRAGALPAMFGGIALLMWSIMLVFQGEGLDLDTQRRRHPVWEFLFSHPVPPGAVFLAEMLSPMAANPIFYSAPLFAGILYGLAYGPWLGVAAAVLVGIPVAASAACLGKALEIAVLLRFSARSRGAVMGLMGWLGYVSMILLFVSSFATGSMVTTAARVLQPLAGLPWPWLGLFLGRWGSGWWFPAGVLTCWTVAALVAAVSLRFSIWGAQLGLVGRADAGPQPGAVPRGAAGFGKNGLYRKEFLWLLRDRSAIVQAFLIPLTMASFQLFNMRGLLAHAQGSWNLLCGAGILFGIYFLSVLGPKSLASEGAALWLPLTWPHGLESLLRAKAWLWSLISTAVVALVLCYAAVVFPGSIWKIALVGIGWFLFARSLAEKTVTLATVTSESGEAQKISYGRRWAAQLGTFTFSIGVLTQQWSVAVMGIVYSIMTAAAMWQNFRARLPYLYDPWSEKLPPPPTLMHAMIAISVLVECGTVFAALPMIFAGPDTVALIHAVSYGVWAVIVSVVLAVFLARRGVRLADVWYWPRTRWPAGAGWRGFLATLLMGAIGGAALGLIGLGYLALLRQIPAAAELLDRAQAQVAAVPHARAGLFIMGVLVAPFAEEFLFRGLLFRALDREWGGWRAVLGSAAFFAIYHPPLSWLPVGILGAANAMVFKTTGRLAPAVALHMAYNAVVFSQ